MERFAGENIAQEMTSPGKVACAVGMTAGRLLAPTGGSLSISLYVSIMAAASFVSGLLLSEPRSGARELIADEGVSG
jgi:hypothetical protein